MTSGSRILGIVEGWGLFSSVIIPKNITGLPICSVEKDGAIHKFIAGNGSEAGRVGYLNYPELFEIQLARSLDVNSKCVLLATAYEIVSSALKSGVMFET